MKSPAFEATSLLYVTPTNSISMQELLLQKHKQKYIRPVLVVEGTLGIYNLSKFYNLRRIF